MLLETCDPISTVEGFLGHISPPFNVPVLTMTSFQLSKSTQSPWFSYPIYTHPQGYKVCLRVDANGYQEGEGTHVSAFLCFLRGDFDDILPWPFRGKLAIQLVDQADSTAHITHRNDYSSIPKEYCCRVIHGESNRGWGQSKFIAHSELEPKYLENDCLKFRILQ